MVGAAPPPTAEQPAGESPAYLEEGTDLILLQVGLDPGLLVRRHEELPRRGLELLSPGGGCGLSGCTRLAPPPPKGCHSGSAAKGRQPRVPGTELTQVTGGGRGSRLPVARLTGRGAAAGGLPSGSSGRALPGAEHGAGKRRAAAAAPEPALCLSVRARPCARQRLGDGNSRGSSCRPRHSAAPEANGRGLLSALRPLAPGLRRTKGGSEGRGRRAGGRRGLLCLRLSAAAPLPSRGRAASPAEERPGPRPAPLPRAGRLPGGPPGLRDLTGTRELHLVEGGGGAKRVSESREWGCRDYSFPNFLNVLYES